MAGGTVRFSAPVIHYVSEITGALKRTLPVLLILSMPLLVGCKTTVIPPQHVLDPVTVAFTDYGRHTSIILPVKQNQWAEYAAGDWDFFALGHNETLVGIKALLGLGKWTIGRRYIDYPPTDPAFVQKLEIKRVVFFQAERSYCDTLRQTLDTLFNAHRTEMFYSSYSGLYHVTGNESYNLFHDCNHSTAEWLRLLGCRVDGMAITSDFDLAKSSHGGHGS